MENENTTKQISNAQLWEMCSDFKSSEKPQSNYGDKAVNWDYERLNWELNRDLK